MWDSVQVASQCFFAIHQIGFNGRFLHETWLASSDFFVCMQRKTTFGGVGQIFAGRMPFSSSSQQCQTTERRVLPRLFATYLLIRTKHIAFCQMQFFVMAALRSRCGHYIFALWFLTSSYGRPMEGIPLYFVPVVSFFLSSFFLA